MVAVNNNRTLPLAGSKPPPPVNRLVERVRRYFDRHPEVGREEFVLDAVRREILFLEQTEARKRSETAGWRGEAARSQFTTRPPLSAEEIRMHVSVAARLAELHYQRYGLWPKLQRFLARKGFGRSLGLRPQRT